MSKISYFVNTYQYFSLLNGKPIQGRLLDYGCNYGLFLDSAVNRFDLSNYTGLDVDKSAINEGQKMFPGATFLHYDRYNIVYNPAGKKTDWPHFDKKFQYIISYSVVTHTPMEDMLETIDWLYQCLEYDGKMFITYISNKNKVALDFFYRKRVQEFGSCEQINTTDFIYLIDNKSTKEPLSSKYFLSFYDNNFLKNVLSRYQVELRSSLDKSLNCFQDCIVISKIL